MSVRMLSICVAAIVAVLVSASPSRAQAELRVGVWDNSTNPNNVMTYEPFEKGGSKLTVSNPSKPEDEWSYETFFDGKFRPVKGQPGSETAVELINGSAKSIRIYNKRDGVVYQVVINTLNEDNTRIDNEYIRMDKDGKITGVTHVTYNKREEVVLRRGLRQGCRRPLDFRRPLSFGRASRRWSAQRQRRQRPHQLQVEAAGLVTDRRSRRRTRPCSRAGCAGS